MKLLGGAALLLSTAAVASRAELRTPPGSGLPVPVASSDDAPPYRDELVSLHKSLVEIASVTYSENEVGNFLVDYLTKRDFTAKLEFLPPSSTPDGAGDKKPRFNVVAWPGSERRRRPSPKVLVTSHIDTVPPHIPYSRSDGDEPPNGETVIRGRGSVDAKASVAAQITAVSELLAAGRVDAGDVMLLFVVGEERTGDGMRHFSDAAAASPGPLGFRAAIFGEPTEGKLACGHKGFFGCTITARGKAGHSGYPWLGKSATEVLIRGLVKVLDADLGSSERFGNTTVNVGTIEGGVALNVIPEVAVARIAGRVAIGPELDGGRIVTGRVEDVLRSVDAEAFETVCNNGYGVVECACDVPDFETITVNYGTDVANLKGDHARYLYGPGSILVAHGANEAIKLKDLEAGVEGYKKLILHVVADEEVKEL
ncbi:putative acetylornithine deacetylase [Rosellinia necatrix]|uniref:Putative acetylornithine deacetylase n=1 Tax=Rosellinia necatrix TaxID=77044 RepID=A0A1W2TTY7_ROSNE|nr:putative acetylornithine deacetylase [Rosellinia necatrix]